MLEVGRGGKHVLDSRLQEALAGLLRPLVLGNGDAMVHLETSV